MIRSELVARIAAQNSHRYERKVDAVVRTVLGRIGDALVAGDRVELRGLGVFETRRHEARKALNPKTGEAVSVPAKAVVRFQEGRAMRARLNPAPPDREPAAEPLRRAS